MSLSLSEHRHIVESIFRTIFTQDQAELTLGSHTTKMFKPLLRAVVDLRGPDVTLSDIEHFLHLENYVALENDTRVSNAVRRELAAYLDTLPGFEASPMLARNQHEQAANEVRRYLSGNNNNARSGLTFHESLDRLNQILDELQAGVPVRLEANLLSLLKRLAREIEQEDGSIFHKAGDARRVFVNGKRRDAEWKLGHPACRWAAIRDLKQIRAEPLSLATGWKPKFYLSLMTLAGAVGLGVSSRG